MLLSHRSLQALCPCCCPNPQEVLGAGAECLALSWTWSIKKSWLELDLLELDLVFQDRLR